MKTTAKYLLLAAAALLPHLRSEGATLTVTNGLKLWLEADAINTADPTQVRKANGNQYVVDWKDQSGNGFDARESVAGSQPQYVAGGPNNLPIIRFDGIASALYSSLPQIAGDKTIFIVQKRVSTTQTGCEIASSTLAGQFIGNSIGAEAAGRIGVAYDLSLPGAVGSVILKTVIRSGTNLTFMVNDQTTTATVPDAASGNYAISCTYWPFPGGIAEVLIYNRALAETERQAVENYLSEKWALWTETLPVQSGLQLWLDAGAINTLQADQVYTSGTQTYVTRWQGGGVAGLNANVAPSAVAPLLIPNALNGRPVVGFNGYNNSMNTTLSQIVGDKSIFTVQMRTSNAIGCEIGSTGSTLSGTGMFLGSNNGWPSGASGPYTEAKGRYGAAFDEQVPTLLNQFVLKNFIRSGSTETLQLNGTSATAYSVPDAASYHYSISDSAFPFKGDMAELMIYNRAVTPAESNTIQDYLQDKWSYAATNVFSVAPDTGVPPMVSGTPAPGIRVQQTVPSYAGTNVYHTLYLPTDWQPGKLYPVIVDYPGNGPYSDSYGDVNTGNVENVNLGYSITGGTGCIWVCMPFVGGSPLANQQLWWGSVAATEDYCMKTVLYVCQNYGGDPSKVILAGFSRGAIACNYIGLWDNNIADVWLAFIPHSHYDGDPEDQAWGYPAEDPASAYTRLLRLAGRAQHISHETALTGPQAYLQSTGVNMTPFSFRTLPYVNHTDTWPQRPLQLRRDIRAWLQSVLATHPGTQAIHGYVTTSAGAPLPGVLIQSGYTHFTYTAADGSYTLAGLINSTRTVTATLAGDSFSSQSVTLSGSDVYNINFMNGQ